MIEAKFFYNEQNRPYGFELNGHAGYDVSGRDIVCSAVSVLAINTINSIDCLTDDRYEFEQDENTGHMIFTMKELSDSSELLLRSMHIGISGIEQEYGQEYVRIL